MSFNGMDSTVLYGNGVVPECCTEKKLISA